MLNVLSKLLFSRVTILYRELSQIINSGLQQDLFPSKGKERNDDDDDDDDATRW